MFLPYRSEFRGNKAQMDLRVGQVLGGLITRQTEPKTEGKVVGEYPLGVDGKSYGS